MSFLPKDPWVGNGEKKRQYDRNADLDSRLSEGKSNKIQASCLLLSASCNVVLESWVCTGRWRVYMCSLGAASLSIAYM